MLPISISITMNSTPRKLISILFILGWLASGCTAAQASDPRTVTVQPTPSVVPQSSTPSPQVLPANPTEESAKDSSISYSSDRLGFCFSYPQGFTQMPYNDAVELVGRQIGPGDEAGLFWLDVGDPQGRTAEQIADQEVKDIVGLNVESWTVSLGGEQALVRDGMPGQDLVRRVYIVHGGSAYILTFSPTRSDNATAGDQMEALYQAVTDSWAWSPCRANP